MIFLDWPASSATLDPDWDKVVLLLHGDGSNGGTIIDSSGSNHTITATGTPAIETSFPKWGSGALLFDATSGYLSAGSSTDWQFGGGDFTIEFWLGSFDWSGVALETPIMAVWSTNPGSALAWFVTIDINNRLAFYFSIGGTLYFGQFSSSGMTGIGSSYRHCAIARDGNTLRIFFDGVVEYSGSMIGSIDLATNTELVIGGLNYSGAQYLNGYLDDVRITKGKARYTADFSSSVPSAPFPDG